MLYRPQPRFAAVRSIARKTAALAGAALNAIRRPGADTIYLDSANENLLKDLGLNRMYDDRHQRLY
jgi:hypothetical protein